MPEDITLNQTNTAQNILHQMKVRHQVMNESIRSSTLPRHFRLALITGSEKHLNSSLSNIQKFWCCFIVQNEALTSQDIVLHCHRVFAKKHLSESIQAAVSSLFRTKLKVSCIKCMTTSSRPYWSLSQVMFLTKTFSYSVVNCLSGYQVIHLFIEIIN